MPLNTNDNLVAVTFLWILAAGLALYIRKQSRAPGVGIVPAYILYFAWIHFVPTLVLLLPWYWPIYDLHLSALGFQISLIGIVSFGLGTLLVRERPFTQVKTGPLDLQSDNWGQLLQSGAFYLSIGVISMLVLTPLVKHVPTVSAAIDALSGLFLVGLLLLWWYGRQTRNRLMLLAIVVSVFTWPLVTAALWGFLGIGLTPVLLLGLFVVSQMQRPLKLLPMLLVLVYLGVSLAVTYSTNREQVRFVAWNATSTVEQRTATALALVSQFEWFDLSEQAHLERIEMHTNQNQLVGATALRIDSGTVDYAGGATLWDAVVMLVPRAIWPDKPIRMGGSAYVNRFAGTEYGGGTSVGMGQTLEFYVNFGVAGVVIGFFLLGTLLSRLDSLAAAALHNGQWPTFALWYATAIPLLQTGNNLLALVAGSVSTWIVVALLNRLSPQRGAMPQYTVVSRHMLPQIAQPNRLSRG